MHPFFSRNLDQPCCLSFHHGAIQAHRDTHTFPYFLGRGAQSERFIGLLEDTGPATMNRGSCHAHQPFRLGFDNPVGKDLTGQFIMRLGTLGHNRLVAIWVEAKSNEMEPSFEVALSKNIERALSTA